MRQSVFEILSNRPLAENIYELCLDGDTTAITAPGQFVDLKLEEPGLFLRRPISVCDWTDGRLRLIYKVLGQGTAALREYPAGRKLDLLTGLGNGYDLVKSGPAPLLVGGGVGIPPLFGLARRLTAAGKRPKAVLGFRHVGEVFLVEEFQSLGIPVTLTTEDGSRGKRGFVTDGMALLEAYSYVYTCGPEPMLRAVYQLCETGGQFSFEERMGCGFGACMGCSRATTTGVKRVCRDGPVLEKEEILWRT